MSILSMRCPLCGAESEIRVEAAAELVVLDCVHCKAPLLHYRGQTMAVDPGVIASLRGRELKAVKGWLRLRRPGLSDDAEESLPSHRAGEPLRETAVGEDDVLDLRIDLAITQDVDEFLRRLG